MRTPSLVLNLIRPGAFLLSIVLLATSAAAGISPLPDPLGPYVELAPFKVNGKQLAISIHARSRSDRSYAEGFAGEVVKVVCESVTPDTGKGLVIIGKKGEPHPIVVFRQFLALAKDGKLDPGVAARAPELQAMLDHWEETVNDENKHGKDSKDSKEANDADDLEFEKIITALPLPLEGIGAKLYQVAWREDFAAARVETALRALHPADLEGSLFTHFDWVFYLPPKNAFDQVLDGIVADALKEDGAGFMERMAAKSVMLFLKPRIRKAIEAVRQGLLFMTVAQARTHYDRAAVSELTGAYLNVLMPDDEKKKVAGANEHERAVNSVRAAREALETKGEKLAEVSPEN